MESTQSSHLHRHVSQADDRMCHQRLPMGDEEQVIAVYRHHWFAYASILFIAVCADIALLGLVAVLVAQGGDVMASWKDTIVMGAVLFSVIVLLFALIPIWLRSQEKLILSDEALYQTLQPSLFSNKVSQLNLAHLADVTARQDFFGTIFGFGHITIETPGEQDNYVFYTLPNAKDVVKEIIEAHENFQAALESGRLPTTFRGAPAVTTAGPQAPVAIDPDQYRQFLAFQQMQQTQQVRPFQTEASEQPPQGQSNNQQ